MAGIADAGVPCMLLHHFSWNGSSAAATVLPSSLQISIVTFEPDLPLLERTLDTLGIAIEAAQDERVLRTVHLALIDNSGDRGIAERVIELDLTSAEKDAFMHSVESVKALVELCQRIAPSLATA